MKIIHCADLHIDSRLLGLSSAKSAQRNDELLYSFDKLCLSAVEQGVAAVIISGDIFDTATPSPRYKRAVIDIFNKYNGLIFAMLSGNHDGAGLTSGVVVNLPSNVKLLDGNGSVVIKDVNICGVALVKGQEAQQLAALKVDKSKTNIAVLHSEVNGSGEYPSIDSKYFIDSDISYVALGHLHSFQKIKAGKTTLCYSGCLEPRGFDELGSKGYVLIEIEGGEVTSEFVSFASRQYYCVKVEASSQDTIVSLRDKVSKAVEDLDCSSVVKVEIVGKVDTLLNIDTESLESRLTDSFFGVKVVDKTQYAPQKADDNTLAGMFVKIVKQSGNTECVEDAIKYGLTALNKEDVK